tara:strand:- start:254 stop:436 length:183 start_codon:yes stop_codon:yes gene_type:complete
MITNLIMTMFLACGDKDKEEDTSALPNDAVEEQQEEANEETEDTSEESNEEGSGETSTEE